MATQRIVRQFAALGGQASLRHKDGKPLITDNSQHILDVRGLLIAEPLALESEINQWPGWWPWASSPTKKPTPACWAPPRACARWHLIDPQNS